MIQRIQHQVEAGDVEGLERAFDSEWDDAGLLCPFNGLQACPGAKCASFNGAYRTRTGFGGLNHYSVYGPSCFRLTHPEPPTSLRVELDQAASFEIRLAESEPLVVIPEHNEPLEVRMLPAETEEV